MNPIQGHALPITGILSYGYQRSATHRHNGIDLPARLGTNVRAAAPGKVTHATETWEQGFTGYGRVVAIEHADGLHTLYAHLDRVAVTPGQLVEAGEVIGTVGTSRFNANDLTFEADPKKAHLHFELAATPYPQKKGSSAPRLDPVAWLATLDNQNEGIAIVDRPFVSAQQLPSSSPVSPHCPSCTCSGGVEI